MTPKLLWWRSDCSLGDAPDSLLLSEFLCARPEPAAPQSAFLAACARPWQPLDKAEDARRELNAESKLAEGTLLRGHVLDMLGLQDELQQAQTQPSA